MDCSVESIYKKLFASGTNPQPDDNTRLHLVILQHYLTFLWMMSESELPDELTSDSAGELNKYVFRVPTLKQQHLGDGISILYRPVKEFISFLVRFLYHKPAGLVSHQIGNVEMDLRFLLTVLGDTSLMQEEFKNLLAEFEDVANEAGCFVHSLFFLTSDAQMDADVVANRMKLLKAHIMELSQVVLPAGVIYMPPKTSVVDSLVVLDLVVRHLEVINFVLSQQ